MPFLFFLMIVQACKAAKPIPSLHSHGLLVEYAEVFRHGSPPPSKLLLKKSRSSRYAPGHIEAVHVALDMLCFFFPSSFESCLT